MELVLATNNLHKKREITRILPGFKIIIPNDMGILFQFKEKEDSFYGNALGKAQSLYELIKRPVVADDSGLCVDALQGMPGTNSARFGSSNLEKTLTDSEKISLLLKKMKNKKNRRAFFVCCMVCIIEQYRIISVQETLCGEITNSPVGENGFGYDPIFFIPELGKTVAQLTDQEKDRISHRGRANRVLVGIIKAIHIKK